MQGPAQQLTGLRSALVLSSALVALVPLAACSGGGSSGGSSKDKTAPTVVATPSTSVFTGASVVVTLTADDNKDANPAIYYTTDLSTPTAASTVYTGPITLTATTVLKAIAIDRRGNVSETMLTGYTKAGSLLEQDWAASGHGAITSEAWRHWDEDGAVPTSCARCHGDGGLKDYAEDGVVDAAGALALGLDCQACHVVPPTTIYEDLGTYPALDPVAFPSADTASLWNNSNMCTTCHQGRSSTVQVDAAVLANPGGPYSFINIHYYAVGATYFGSEVQGGYQFAGQEYVGRNVFGSHDPLQQDCVGCHMRGTKDHTFAPQLSDCTTCHAATGGFETLSGSPAANYAAINSSAAELLADMQAYASAAIGTPFAHDPTSYPYFFVDDNDNGVVDPGETEGFKEFDENLLRAAYNYQVVLKDPAGYIHNGTYLRQLLHDSILHVGGVPSVPAPGRAGFDTNNASKSEQWHLSGHADSNAEAFRHWDGDPDVPASCAKCHTSVGFVDYVADGTVDAPAPLGDLVECSACHGELNLFLDEDTRYLDLATNAALEPVTFPSGATATLAGSSNICMTCHQGRESGLSIDANLPNTAVQTPVDYDSFDFVNRHYFAAGAIFFGSDVTAAYEYAGNTYAGRNVYPSHPGSIKVCTDCHMRNQSDHTFRPLISDCDGCHQFISDFEDLGLAFGVPNFDWDGDGVGLSFQGEIDGMTDAVYAGIQAYAVTQLAQPSPVIYVPTSYPYWFKDSDGDGLLSEGEDSFANRYRDFDRAMLRAAFNFHSAQDPGSDIHNYKYVLQTLYDAADDLDDGLLNGSVPGTRP